MFKVSSSSAVLRFNDYLLILLHRLLTPCFSFFPFLKYVLLFLPSPSSSIPFRHSSVSSFHLWWLSTSTCHCSTQSLFTSARQQMDLLFPPFKKESAPKSLLCLQVHLKRFSVSTRARANRRACGTHKYAWTGILLCCKWLTVIRTLHLSVGVEISSYRLTVHP